LSSIQKGKAKNPVRYNAVKGVQDILPPDIYVWQRMESVASEVFGAFGFQELRAPVMEFTEIFVRSIGETSDIVEKEMYTFEDKGGRSITLRPEGTAPVVRCYVQNHLYNRPAPQKFYYSGPMFRYERPQRGRQRQFYQIGVEAFGDEGPAIDAEVISMLRHFLKRIGLGSLRFEINSIGCSECRPSYREALKDFFSDKVKLLCPDCARRLQANPMRILDCKVPGCMKSRKGAPLVGDHLCTGCKDHFGRLRELLEIVDVPYFVNPAMVRGLDYYTRTTFEVTSENLGAQNAVAAGGRYDGLVEEFGGPKTPAIGFAVGMERLVSLLKDAPLTTPTPLLFIAALGNEAAQKALTVADGLRSEGIWAETGSPSNSLRSQMKRADKLGAAYVLFLGEDEINAGVAGWKNLGDGTEGKVSISEVHDFFVERKNVL
jgi:histidyl-tRNA synthetase